MKALKITSGIELEKRLAELIASTANSDGAMKQLRDLRRNEVAAKTCINNGPLHSIEKSATRGLDQGPIASLNLLAVDFADACVSRRNMVLGFEIDFKRLLAELKNGPMASRDQETLEIERSER